MQVDELHALSCIALKLLMPLKAPARLLKNWWTTIVIPSHARFLAHARIIFETLEKQIPRSE
jgi:hypothetical protein